MSFELGGKPGGPAFGCADANKIDVGHVGSKSKDSIARQKSQRLILMDERPGRGAASRTRSLLDLNASLFFVRLLRKLGRLRRADLEPRLFSPRKFGLRSNQ